jgi:MFS family permease
MEIKTFAEKSFRKDGCLAWVVCLAAFLTNAVALGIDLSFGETIGCLVRDFNATEGDVAWIGSLHSGAQFFSGFAASPLTNYLGLGPVVAIGAFVATSSFGIALFCPDIPCLAATYGVLAGLGCGLAYTPANIVCTLYFEKKRVIAVALSASGGGFGIVIMSYCINIVNAKYSWKGSILLCMIVTSLISFLALILWIFPIPKKEQSTDSKNVVRRKELKRFKVSLTILSLEASVLYLYFIFSFKTR